MTHDGTLRGRIPPRLIIAREHTQMVPSYELLVVQPGGGVVAAEEVRVEDDLDAVVVPRWWPLSGRVSRLSA